MQRSQKTASTRFRLKRESLLVWFVSEGRRARYVTGPSAAHSIADAIASFRHFRCHVQTSGPLVRRPDFGLRDLRRVC
jgi:hypothetical protein